MWQCKELKWEVFDWLEPRFETMGFFVVVFVLFFLIFFVFCLDKCFSLIWMIDGSVLW